MALCLCCWRARGEGEDATREDRNVPASFNAEGGVACTWEEEEEEEEELGVGVG